ncbi:putative sulfate transporter YbaR [Lentibacillus sp. JNUCC-1]|nr:putative sulfate transporter YbaR [Lentibacillus sp. JNUCC-1]
MSALVAGTFLMTLILLLKDFVVQIPMAALVGVMIMVSIGTFEWSTLKTLHKTPITDTTVMVATVGTVLLTNDLSKGVLVGVVLSAIFFAAKISKIKVTRIASDDSSKVVYQVAGQLFFASTTEFTESFSYQEDIQSVKIDLTHAHLWDDSAVGAIDKVIMKYEQNGIQVEINGLNQESDQLLKKLAVHHTDSKFEEAVNS